MAVFAEKKLSYHDDSSVSEGRLNTSNFGRSHYQFKNWVWENGERRAAAPVIPLHRALPDLISTAVFNPRRNSQTVLTVTVDIDFKRCGSEWISGGKVDAEKVKDFLWDHHTPIYMAIDAIVESTSGKGFHLVFGVQPIEVGGLSRQIYYRWRLESVQRRLITLLSEVGIGADPAAKGAVRDFPNYLNPAKILYGSAEWVLRSQSQKESDKVFDLDEYLELSGYPRKELVEKPFGEMRVAQSVAKLYCFLADVFLDGDGIQTLQLKELCDLSGCCEPFLRKFLRAPPAWLSASFCGKAEGWKISLTDGLALFEKARVAAESQSVPKKSSKPFNLCPPELVGDGERNPWIKGIAVWLKHSGIEEQGARTLIGSLITRIPGFERSRNCRAYLSIVKSIYGSRKFKDLFGCRAGQQLPDWLIGEGSRENVINSIEGDVVPLPSESAESSLMHRVDSAAGKVKSGTDSNPLDMVSYEQKGKSNPKQGGPGVRQDKAQFRSSGFSPVLAKWQSAMNRVFAPDHAGDGRVKRKTECVQAVTKVNLVSSENTRGSRPDPQPGKTLTEQRGINFPRQLQYSSTGVLEDGMYTQGQLSQLERSRSFQEARDPPGI